MKEMSQIGQATTAGTLFSAILNKYGEGMASQPHLKEWVELCALVCPEAQLTIGAVTMGLEVLSGCPDHPWHDYSAKLLELGLASHRPENLHEAQAQLKVFKAFLTRVADEYSGNEQAVIQYAFAQAVKRMGRPA